MTYALAIETYPSLTILTIPELVAMRQQAKRDDRDFFQAIEAILKQYAEQD